PPDEIPFEYNRERAAAYARFTSAYNFEHTPDLIMTVTVGNYDKQRYSRVVYGDILFSGYKNVTGQWLSSGFNSTGSAVYMSQALWHGGLPMLINRDANQITENIGGDGNAEEISGWLFCPETGHQ